MSRHHKHKSSVQITRVYEISAQYNSWPYKAIDGHLAWRLARYVKGRGHGKILTDPTKARWSFCVVVSLTASPAVHKEVVAHVKGRGGSIVPRRTNKTLSMSKRHKKGTWYVGGVYCSICGVCKGYRRSYERGTQQETPCEACAQLTHLMQIVVAGSRNSE
jgi:hypothetical protein